MANYHLLEGFDLYNGAAADGAGLLSTWQRPGTAGTVSLVAGRFGGQALQMRDATGNTSLVRRTWAAAGSNFSLGFAFRQTRFDLITNDTFCWIEMNAAVQLSIGLDCTNGQVIVYRGAGTTPLISSAVGLMSQGTWAYIELFGTIHQTTGTLDLYVNGSFIGNYTGDTAALANVTYNGIAFRSQDGTGAASNSEFDDLFMTDTAARVGEARVETLRPVADTAAKAWTASTGTDNYAMLDEAQASPADYVTATTVNDLDLYELANLSSNPAAVYAVKAKVFAGKTDAQTRKIATVIRSNATDSQSADFALAPQGSSFNAVPLPLDPDGAVAWTTAKINALKAGVKVTV